MGARIAPGCCMRPLRHRSISWKGRMLAALVRVVSLTRYGIAGFSLVDRFAAMLANFLVAIPLLVVTVGPFLVRRTRRGLQKRRQ